MALFPSVAGQAWVEPDASWRWAINWLPHSPYRFGLDVVTAWGPLGYLVAPLDLRSNLVWSILYRLLVHLALVGLSLRAMMRAPLAAAPLLVVGLALAGTFASADTLQLAALALCCASLLEEPGLWRAGLAALLAATLLYVRFTPGLAGLATIAATVIAGLSSPRLPARTSLVLCAAYAAIAAALGLALFGAPANALAWLGGSLQLAQASSWALSLPAPDGPLWAALGIAAALALLARWLRREDSEAFRTALLLAPALLLAFKDAFARQDLYAGAFFGLAVAAGAVVGVQARSERAAAVAAGAVAAVAALSVAATAPFGQWDAGASLRLLAGAEGMGAMSQLARLSAERERLRAQRERELSSDKLPADWIKLVQERGGTVDVVSGRFALAPASGLRWRPSPHLSSHDVFTPEMDQRQAAHYRGDRAADFLIVELPQQDARHPLLDMPEGFRAIRERYEVAARDSAGRRLLLRRRSAPRAWSYGRRGELTFFDVSRGAKIPEAMRESLAALGLRPSLHARLAGLLYRLPPVYVHPRYQDGKEGLVRVQPALGAQGLPLTALPRDVDELARWLEGEPAGAVRELRFSGPGLRYLGEVASLAFIPPAGAHASK